MKKPRGIRNNNPANIRWGENWDGLDEKGMEKDPAFCVFKEVKWGIRALAKILMTYKRKYGLDTIKGIICRFAPPNENDTSSYMQHIADALGVGIEDKINIMDTQTMFVLIKAIIRHENGQQPYTDAEIRGGMFMAGIS